jgi:hypothetical protein
MAGVVRGGRLPTEVKKIIDSYGKDNERQRKVEQTLSRTHSCQCQAALRVVNGAIHQGERVNISMAEQCPPSSNCPPHVVVYAILKVMLTFLSQNTLYPTKATLHVQNFVFTVNMDEGVFDVAGVAPRDRVFRARFGLRGRLAGGDGFYQGRALWMEAVSTKIVQFAREISTHWVPAALTCRRGHESTTVNVELAFKQRNV